MHQDSDLQKSPGVGINQKNRSNDKRFGSGVRRIDPKDGDQLTIGRGLRRTISDFQPAATHPGKAEKGVSISGCDIQLRGQR